MITEKMTYSYNAIAECKEILDEVGITVKRKNEHPAKALELGVAMRKCFNLTNCLLFDPDWNPQFEAYKGNANRYKEYKKNNLDKELRMVMLDLKRYVRDIRRDMDSGAVNSRP